MKTSPGCERDLQPVHALDHRLDGELHRADEDRQPELALGDQLAAVAVVDAVGAVERLGDHRAEGAAHERQVHLVADLHQAVLQDGQGDGVDRHAAVSEALTPSVGECRQRSGPMLARSADAPWSSAPTSDRHQHRRRRLTAADRRSGCRSHRPRPGCPARRRSCSRAARRSPGRRIAHRRQPLAHVDRRLVPAAVEPDRPGRPPRLGERRLRRGRRERRQRHRLALADHRGVQVDEHRPDLGQLDAETLPVRAANAARSSATVIAVESIATGRMWLWPWNCMSARCSVTTARRRRSRARAAHGRSRSARRRLARPGPPRAPRAAGSRCDEVVPQVGDDAAERVGEPRPRRDQQLRDAELARQRGRMQRPGAAESEQGEVARIVAARQARPCGSRRPSCRWRRGRSRPPRRSRRGRAARRRGRAAPPHRVHRDRVLDGEQPLGVEPAEHQVGVGDRRPRAAAAVADRPGVAPALSGPTRSMPAASTEAIEPPPAPIVCTSTIGTWIGIAYSSSRSLDTDGRPPSTRATSLEVPPMS